MRLYNLLIENNLYKHMSRSPENDPEKLHVGKWACRLAPSQDNPREAAFAAQWAKEQRDGRILDHLIGNDCSPRDAMVAATVIQWLGSNVGMSFLELVIAAEPKVAARLKASTQTSDKAEKTKPTPTGYANALGKCPCCGSHSVISDVPSTARCLKCGWRDDDSWWPRR